MLLSAGDHCRRASVAADIRPDRIDMREHADHARLIGSAGLPKLSSRSYSYECSRVGQPLRFESIRAAPCAIKCSYKRFSDRKSGGFPENPPAGFSEHGLTNLLLSGPRSTEAPTRAGAPGVILE